MIGALSSCHQRSFFWQQGEGEGEGGTAVRFLPSELLRSHERQDSRIPGVKVDREYQENMVC